MRYQAALRPEEGRILQMEPGKVNRAEHFITDKKVDAPRRHDENISKLPVTQEDAHNSGIIGDTHIFLYLTDCLQCSDISDI
jgi:hypothetical protein